MATRPPKWTMTRRILGLRLVRATWIGGLGAGDDLAQPVEVTAPATAPTSENEDTIARTAIEPVASATVAIPGLSVSTQTRADGEDQFCGLNVRDKG